MSKRDKQIKTVQDFLKVCTDWRSAWSGSMPIVEVDCKARDEYVTPEEAACLHELGMVNIVSYGFSKSYKGIDYEPTAMTCGWAIFARRTDVDAVLDMPQDLTPQAVEQAAEETVAQMDKGENPLNYMRHKHYPGANAWMWNNVCNTFLGQWTDSKGKHYDLGIHINPNPDVHRDPALERLRYSEATVYGNEPGSYLSGPMVLDIWIKNNAPDIHARQAEALRRARLMKLID